MDFEALALGAQQQLNAIKPAIVLAGSSNQLIKGLFAIKIKAAEGIGKLVFKHHMQKTVEASGGEFPGRLSSHHRRIFHQSGALDDFYIGMVFKNIFYLSEMLNTGGQVNIHIADHFTAVVRRAGSQGDPHAPLWRFQIMDLGIFFAQPTADGLGGVSGAIIDDGQLIIKQLVFFKENQGF